MSSRIASLPSRALLPFDALARLGPSREVDVAVSGLDVNIVLPATLDADPGLANGRAEGRFGIDAAAYPRDVPVTIR